MKEFDYAVYDAFTDAPLGGSPAALVANAQGLSSTEMQRIAKEFGAPATGFITGFDGSTVNIRFFSTQTEYPMCGHGTIALARWLVDRGEVEFEDNIPRVLTLKTPAREATLTVSQPSPGKIEALLKLQAAPFATFDQHIGEIEALLGTTEEQILSSPPLATSSTDFNHLIIPFKTLDGVDALAPNFSALSAFCKAQQLDTVMVYTLQTESENHSVHCREFAPAVGTNEVAATGTTNRAMACYLHAYEVIEMPKNGKITILAEQGYAMGRPSIVKSSLLIEQGKVIEVDVGGAAARVMVGKITL